MKSGSTSIHFTVDQQNMSLFLKLILFCNQLRTFLALEKILMEKLRTLTTEAEEGLKSHNVRVRTASNTCRRLWVMDISAKLVWLFLLNMERVFSALKSSRCTFQEGDASRVIRAFWRNWT